VYDNLYCPACTNFSIRIYLKPKVGLIKVWFPEPEFTSRTCHFKYPGQSTYIKKCLFSLRRKTLIVGENGFWKNNVN